MAAVVLRGSSQISSPISVQEKGSRNKRKYRADLPLVDQNKLLPSQSECPAYEISIEKSQNNPSAERNGVCGLPSSSQGQLDVFKSDLRSTGSGGSSDRKDLEVEEFQDVDWSDLTETMLEELVLSNLDMIFKSAIKKITSFGHSEEVATKAVLRSGLCYGCKDTELNIVDSTLAFLRSGQEIDTSREHSFDDLQQLERYVLAEMVCVLMEVRPFFSTGDAMWCLLICDMNVSHACMMDGDPMSSLSSDDKVDCSSVSTVQQIKSDGGDSITSIPGPIVLRPNRLNPFSGASGNASDVVPDRLIPEKGSSISSVDSVAESSAVTEDCIPSVSPSSSLEEKSGSSERSRTNSSRKEPIHHQKSSHLEKHLRHGAKGALKTGKLSSFGGLFLDKKCKSISESNALNLKNPSSKLSRAVGTDVFQADGNTNLSIKVGPTSDSVSSSKPVSGSPALPVANTDLSLSLPSENSSTTENGSFSYAGISCDKSFGQLVPRDKQDEALLKLALRVQVLQNQMQEWTEWGTQRVMQVTCKLSKDNAELKTLRQEKEEAVRVKKEKQTLEENNMKKLLEMENALCKASGQVERANADVCRLEVENSELRKDMEAAKLWAAESAASFLEVSRREKKMLKEFESWERRKAMFQEELVAEKRKLSQLQQQVEQAKDYQAQLEARWRQEEKVKEEALMQANSVRKEREQIEVSAKTKEETIRLKAESDFQSDRDDIWRLEKEIAQLRLKTDSSKIAALRRGIDCTYASRVMDGRSISALKETHTHHISEMANFEDWGVGDVRRERECVMCLTEEMSVVFLPCAHQVVCPNCNELHEKNGMKDCPSCRTPIQRRVCVLSADSKPTSTAV
ncbi:putative E3 ubiquitin-protein ligase RF298 [Magnolia sinica]|uniref:putative E3 ubiquitin-protein ligase RF298 n=1 Tax=Magnolia sinica TaxID=86752 RepID=UPI00265AAED2|nr:putative E3 ubiquitin-protein ligase RF298 [Magnolia sinica]XP_058082624.1 putative E3 ubiquitin-protein ligase RF298 [Magnolia sinica]